ncbi:hypothetical protein [Flexivirga sp. B27]
MTRRRMFAMVAGVVLALAVVLPTSASASVQARPSGAQKVAMCLSHKAFPGAERTIHVPEFVVGLLLRTTASYRGPCATYGDSALRGDGRLTAYTQQEHGKPHAIGVTLTDPTLDGLPHEPPTDGKWCFDKDGDGNVDLMTECANGYGNILQLGATAGTPFSYLMVDWNPHGHGPSGVYDLPHFDVHFYQQPDAQRRAIRPGPCPELVNCEDFQLGKKLPAAKYRNPDFADLDAQSPGMGNHLIDRSGPEFHGKRFTHTFIYGSWNKHISFYEPMVTREFLQGLQTGSRADTCAPIKQPEAFEKSGWYPTKYCMRHRANRGELTVSVEGFVHRAAG